MADVRVSLDAGHGGHNTGATSPSGLTLECDITLAIMLAATAFNPKLHLIREGDETIDFEERNKRAKAAGANLVISGHLDSTPWAPEQHGLHAYYHAGNTVTRSLAHYALGQAPKELRGGTVICAHDNPHIREDDWKRRAEYICEVYAADVLLIEFGYLSNPRDLEYCISSYGIGACAELVVRVAEQYTNLITQPI